MTIIHASQQRRLPPPALARAIRKAAGATQAEVAAALGVSQPTVARWEAGTRRPSPDEAERYAALLRAMQEATL